MSAVLVLIAVAGFGAWWTAPLESVSKPRGPMPATTGPVVSGPTRTGFVTDPVLAAGLLIERRGDGVWAENPATAGVVWKLSRPGRPKVVSVGAAGDRYAVVLWSDHRLDFVDARTGRHRHTTASAPPPDSWADEPAGIDSTMAGFTTAGGVPAIALASSTAVTAYDAAGARRLWTFRLTRNCPALGSYGDHVTTARVQDMTPAPAVGGTGNPQLALFTECPGGESPKAIVLDTANGTPVAGLNGLPGFGALLPTGTGDYLQQEPATGIIGGNDRLLSGGSGTDLGGYPYGPGRSAAGEGLLAFVSGDARSSVVVYRARDKTAAWHHDFDTPGLGVQIQDVAISPGGIVRVIVRGLGGATVESYSATGHHLGSLPLAPFRNGGKPFFTGDVDGTLIICDDNTLTDLDSRAGSPTSAPLAFMVLTAATP